MELQYGQAQPGGKLAFVDKLRSTGVQIVQDTRGVPGILADAFRSFHSSRAAQAAASLAYYALFSIFPLLLLIVSIGGYILENETVYQLVISITSQALPVSEALIQGNLQHIQFIRGPVGLVSILTILWSASGVFRVLVANVNLAWPQAKQHNFFHSSTLALGMVGVMFGLFGLAVLSTLAMSLVQRLRIPLLGNASVYESLHWSLVSRYLPWLIIFLLFLLLYHRVPNVHVRWRAAFWSALLASAAWIMTTRAFTWYLHSGLGRYEVIYGSLGTVVTWMLLTYIGSWIVLFGSHLSAAIQRYLENGSAPQAPVEER